MRDFKFRIWSNYQGGKMIFNNEIGFYEKAYLHENGYWQTSSLHTLFERDDVKVMQSTGLKDKNGREIYEGDILKGAAKKLVFVEFLNGSFGFIDKRKISFYGEAEEEYWSFLGMEYNEDIEVLGNIYENKELL